MPTKEELKYYQAMPLEVKIGMTKNRIREWVREYGTNGARKQFAYATMVKKRVQRF